MKSYILVVTVVALSLGLLTTLRIDTPKQGFAYLLNGEDHVARGEDMQTDQNTYGAYGIGYGEQQTRFYLAEKTKLTLVDASTNVPRLALREGRVVTNGPVEITIRNTTIKADGVMSFVFYSWLDKLEVADIGNGTAYSVNTLEVDGIKTPITFDPINSSAAVFYTWALENAIK